MDWNFWRLVLLVVAAGVWFYYNNVSSGLLGGSNGGTVTYHVDGAGKALEVSYMTSSGISRETDLNLPWTRTVYGVSVASLVGQLNESSGSISCEISGDATAYNSSSGGYAMVTCAGSVH